jgi:hypothetical protein
VAEPWHVQLIWAWIGVGHDPYWSQTVGPSVVRTVYVLRDSGPNLAEWITAIGTAVTGLGVISVFFGAKTANRTLDATLQQVQGTKEAIDQAETSRKTAVFLETQERWDQKDLVWIRQSLKDLTAAQFRQRFERSFQANTGEWYDLVKLGNYFENLAILESAGGADFELINTSIGNSVIHYWTLYGPTIVDDRTRWASFYANWQRLAEDIIEYRDKHGDPDNPPSRLDPSDDP